MDKNGALTVIQKVRGQKKSFKALVEYVKENAYDPSKQTIAVCHGEDEAALGFVKELLEIQKLCAKFGGKECSPKDYLITTVGCAIGAHTGRGIVGICFFDADNGKFRKYFEE